ncbi:MAG: NAD(P)H-dependent oxidoreductase [Gemmatimonadota bacterium]|nr:NAD(P)H-dependent oxidoreductase [Gemmatimonadota bacterium]
MAARTLSRGRWALGFDVDVGMQPSFHLLAVSGSLRTGSVNTEVLRAIIQVAPDDVKIANYDGLARLPHFNPDDEISTQSAAVADWRAQLQNADAVIICSPEYAHGVPGVLKNALDWVVGTGEFMYKPVALINASPASKFVGPQLSETITVMMGNVVPAASITLSIAGTKRDATSIVGNDELVVELRGALIALTNAVNAHRAAVDARA